MRESYLLDLMLYKRSLSHQIGGEEQTTNKKEKEMAEKKRSRQQGIGDGCDAQGAESHRRQTAKNRGGSSLKRHKEGVTERGKQRRVGRRGKQIKSNIQRRRSLFKGSMNFLCPC